MTPQRTRRSGIPALVVDGTSRLPGRLGELAGGTAARLRETRFVGLVAEVAFFLLVGAVPLGVAVLALLGGLEPLIDRATFAQVEDSFRQLINTSLARDVATRAERGIQELLDGGLARAAVPLLVALVISSRGFTGATRGLSHLYGTEPHRPLWRDALATAAFTAAAALVVMTAAIGALLQPLTGGAFGAGIAVGRWVVLIALLVPYYTTLYWYARGADGTWRWELVGGTFATVGVIVAGLVYGAYLRSTPSAGLGPFLGPIVGTVLATFSLVFAIAAIILIGGAINAERAARAADRE